LRISNVVKKCAIGFKLRGIFVTHNNPLCFAMGRYKLCGE
jgi:hypothetical protein